MANLKNTVISDTGFFKLPVGDTAARPASPTARQLRFNTDTGQLEQFRPGLGAWIAPSNTGVIATGGDAVYDVDVEGTTYRVHVFTATGTSTFSVLQGGEVEYLIVAGGGGANFNAASSASGASGGAGGLLTGKTDIISQTYTVTVGEGGSKPSSAGTPWNNAAGSGEDSNVFGITAIGGGHGGTWSGNTGGSGGSGGGRGGSTGFGTNGGSGIPGQGNDGGPGNRIAGAGGGAGTPGEFRDATDGRGNFGGIGISSNITGQSHFYAGGGSSGSRNSSEIAPGGLGGGGTGGTSSAGFGLGQNGTSNTGGGGGGGAQDGLNNSGGAGGSGIVIIRYPLRQNNPETAAGQDVGDGLVLDLDFAKPTVYSGSGSVVSDSRLNGIEGSINGPSFVNPRTQRSAFEFDGSDDFINLGNNRILKPDVISVESFVQNNQPGKLSFICGGGRTGDEGYWLSVRSSRVRWSVRTVDNNGAQFDSDFSSDLDDSNALNHIIGTYDGSQVKIYINGVLINTFSATGNINYGSTIDDNVHVGDIGSSGSTSSRYWDGSIYMVKIYNRALTSTEVIQQFNATRWRFGV